MCCRKLKKYKEAVKMFRDVSLYFLNFIVGISIKMEMMSFIIIGKFLDLSILF